MELNLSLMTIITLKSVLILGNIKVVSNTRIIEKNEKDSNKMCGILF